MTIDLVAQTRCSNHGVVAKLEILLQGNALTTVFQFICITKSFASFHSNKTENPVLCDENLPQLVGLFEMYHARLLGIAHCIVPQLLPIPVEQQSQALLQQPPIELLASVIQPQSHPILPNNMPMLQSPSIVQIIVPANTIPQHAHIGEKLNQADEEIAENETLSDASQSTAEVVSTQDSLTSNSTEATTVAATSTTTATSSTTTTTTTAQYPEDDIDEMILNEDDYNQENEERKRDRSDFKYVESFEGEKSNPVRRFEPDPITDNETELKNVIHENFSEIPSVLPVPKALSSPKDSSASLSSSEIDDEPPEQSSTLDEQIP